MGIRIANAHNIPVLNLATLTPRQACQQLQELKSQCQTLTPTTTKITPAPKPQDTPEALTQSWREHHTTTTTLYNANPCNTPGYDTLIERTRALATTNQLPQSLQNALSHHTKLITAWQQRLNHIQTDWNKLTARHDGVSPFYAPGYSALQARIRSFSNDLKTAHVSPTEKAPYQDQMNAYSNHHQTVTSGLSELTTMAKLACDHLNAHTHSQHITIPSTHAQHAEWERHLARTDLINTDHPRYPQWQARAERLITASQNMLTSQLPDYRAHRTSNTAQTIIHRAANTLKSTLPSRPTSRAHPQNRPPTNSTTRPTT